MEIEKRMALFRSIEFPPIGKFRPLRFKYLLSFFIESYSLDLDP